MIPLTFLLFAAAILTIMSVILAVKLLTLRKLNAGLETQLKEQNGKYETDIKKWSDYANALKNQLQRLSKYAAIADADDKAKQFLAQALATLNKANTDAKVIIAEATANANSLQEKAKQILDAANRQAKDLEESSHTAATQQAAAITTEAREKARKLQDEAKELLNSASLQAQRLVEDAKKQAQEIAGSAYDAMNNAALYERTAKAMKNIIEGYGDQYLVPSHSVLDDLADEFGHTEAARELKTARERCKAMIRNGTAATCLYVEANRRDTAVNFVLDAFNGKVDSILSRVKETNVGTLEQEIRDAFALVNLNGKAFREARITEIYLAARLDELKWGAVVRQLKVEEQEEQRRIKEQMREEEKARREYERAIREAAKEEEMLHKAMEKAQQQLAKAGAEEKAKYEQQIQDLMAKLQVAEDKNQRALSMAQQTKRGHVYIISNIGSFGEDVLKIGLTRRLEPVDRVRELGDSSVPFEFDVHALIFSEDAPALETRLHKSFVLAQMNKVNPRKEFFRVPITAIKKEVEKMGLEAKWTIMAEARQYRETLKIEQDIKDNPALRESWVRDQEEKQKLQPAELLAEEELPLAE